jgi:hypothetical protein
MKLLNRTKLVLLLAPIIVMSFTFLADKANFSGTWSLNEGKSDLGQRARFATKTIKIEQKDDAIAITRTSPSFNGGDDVTTTETLGFDGKEVQTTGFANSTRKSTLKWAEDGQSFTVTSNTTMERNGQSFEFSAKETWSLADGGKSLSVVTVSSSQRGEATTKAMYDKQ